MNYSSSSTVVPERKASRALTSRAELAEIEGRRERDTDSPSRVHGNANLKAGEACIAMIPGTRHERALTELIICMFISLWLL